MLYEYEYDYSSERLSQVSQEMGHLVNALNSAKNACSALVQARADNQGKDIATQERIVFAKSVYERRQILALAHRVKQMQGRLRQLCSWGPPTYKDEELQMHVYHVDIVSATETYLRALSVVAGREKSIDFFGASESTDPVSELYDRFSPEAHALMKNMRDIPEWFGSPRYEKATVILAQCLASAIAAKGKPVLIDTTGLSSANLKEINTYLRKADWLGGQHEPNSVFAYPHFEVLMPALAH